MSLDTPAEKAIRAAHAVVESAGCHPLLTAAGQLLLAAKDKVSDFVEIDRFFISKDDSGHHYLIPVVNRADWEHWRDMGEGGGSVPHYAKILGRNPELVEFSFPNL